MKCDPDNQCGNKVSECTSPQVCDGDGDCIECTSDADCTDTTKPNCCSDGTCKATCGCTPPAPTCSNCQTTSCVNGSWTQCAGGCSDPNAPCCNTNTCGPTTCTLNQADIKNCMKCDPNNQCGNKVSKCTSPQVCDGDGDCIECTSDVNCGCGGACSNGTCSPRGPDCTVTQTCDCCPYQCNEIRCEIHGDCPTGYQCTVNDYSGNTTGYCYN